jgi:hypothetical protein
MRKEINKPESVLCPVGRFFSDLEVAFGGKSKFFEHIISSRVEFLKAIKTLVDEKIEHLENKKAGKSRRKTTKIAVE